MKTKFPSHPELRVAATVGGEDLACGDYISVLYETVDFPSFFWSECGGGLAPHEPVRMRIIAREAGKPYRVFAICLPFVYAKTPRGELTTIDIRRTELVRIDPQCGREVWKELKARSTQTAGDER